ncbi:hypothetical protein [Actinoplanes palleronii]|uniref:PIN domain-containing protein n=1 Tax=Actinoplanes palleronii TaxID=113570 RepID=A0ABQ4BRW2_9ACTN|nr:hypothetical protein [Actinoplanes palleronii]GIE73402.1 hypothetical protein Apa02nite_095100 [Actinoplanes palleronii]
MNPHHSLRVLDASALVELMQGHPKMMQLVGQAHVGARTVVVPALAALEAQVAVRAKVSIWDHLLKLPGLRDLDLPARTAIQVGDIAGPRLQRYPLHTELMAEQMVAQIVHEASQMNAVVVTRIPTLYRGYPIVLMEL